jgi:glyoxylase-like metal-dependent hydrolase (beta-lactamase superfamily II)
MNGMRHASIIHEVDAGEFSVRGVLIHGRKFQLVWDTLTHPRDMAGFAEACAGRQCIVVYSHADWDHVQGTAALLNPLVIGHRECARRFQTEARQTLAELQAEDTDKWTGVELVAPDITFESRLDLDLGGLVVSLHALPGHTPDSIVAFIPAMGLLLAGDAVELPCPCVPPDCDLDAWIQSLERWRDHAQVRRVITSHGPSGGKEILDSAIDYLTGLREGVPRPMPKGVRPMYVSTHAENLKNCTPRASATPARSF